ncbi:MAG TPA: AAA family ATPase [Clostridiales bacterium]|nr:AAA family ATPase [Clostridiales bacterium]
MVIERIKLKNFKNFENLDLKLGQMNVIVGANASGKTNFIESIKFIRDIQKHGIENAISMQGGMKFLQNFNSDENNTTSISTDFNFANQMILHRTKYKTVIVSDFNRISYMIELSSRADKKNIIESEKIIFNFELREIDSEIFKNPRLSRKEFEQNSHFLDKRFFTIKSENGKESSESRMYLDSVKYELLNKKHIKARTLEPITLPPFSNIYDSDKSGRKSILERISKKFLDLSQLSIYDFDIKKMKNPASIAAKAELEENGENLAIVMKKIFEDKKKLTQFSNQIKDILPFINDIDTENSYDKSISLKVKEKYNPDTAIPGSLLSDGTVSITAILTALYFEDKSMAIFEEPEHGVHPSLISKLMESFYDASKNKQIIITTHSPEVLKNTVKEDIFLLLRKDNGNASIVKPHKNKMVKSFLKNELGIDQLFIQNLLES